MRERFSENPSKVLTGSPEHRAYSLVLYCLLHKLVSDFHYSYMLWCETQERSACVRQTRQTERPGRTRLAHIYDDGLFLERDPDIRRTYMVTYCFPEKLPNVKDL